jgi:very-short-patch-repair endonuclease
VIPLSQKLESTLSKLCNSTVDIALPEERIVLEVDGPQQFTTNTLRPLGDMLCK